MMTDRIKDFEREMRAHLTERLIPFWSGLRDDEYGGFYGYMSYDGETDHRAVKGCILNSRILWFFSAAYSLLGTEMLLDEARHAYEFLRDFCLDKEYGGVFWSVNFDGSVCEDIKHTYNQAFAVYALTAYYAASHNREALDAAWELYRIIEEKCSDEGGYLESFERDFSPADNEKLSENGVIAERTMNTLLHVFEAYTELYRVTGAAEVEERLRYILGLFRDKLYNPEKRRLEVFFDRDYSSLTDLHSYGHDIETSWLIDHGCDIIGDERLTARMREITSALAQRIYERAYVNGSVLNECENGTDKTNRIWWIQAESVVGFFNAWEKAPRHGEYLDAALEIREYIRTHIIDPRPFSEWFWEADENGSPIEGRPIVEPWKCPYHNGRMCIRIIQRISEM